MLECDRAGRVMTGFPAWTVANVAAGESEAGRTRLSQLPPRVRLVCETRRPMDRTMTAEQPVAAALTATSMATQSGTQAYLRVRPRLLGLAYRLLGSRMDAEDVVQEAWLKLYGTDLDSIRDPEAWLVTVVTRLGIDRLRQLRARREDYLGPWLPEPLLNDGRNAESLLELTADLSMGFMVALERLGPEERAAYLLREVFDYSYAELGEMLGRNATACRQMVSRARTRIRRARPRFKVDAATHHHLVQRFVDALMNQDTDAFVALLAEEVSWVSDGGGKANAATRTIHGIRATTRLARGIVNRWSGQWQAAVVSVNGQPGIVLRENGMVRSVMALEIGCPEGDGLESGRIIAIYSVLNPDKLGSPADR